MSEAVRLYSHKSFLSSRRAVSADVLVLAPAVLRSKAQKGFLKAAARYV
jgi:hypothetical protein